jgi:hydrogenase maturation protease
MAKLTVLGLGNILMRDEGVGVHLMRAVRASRHWPDDVEFIDGGAGGLNLLSVIERAEKLLVLDAAEMHLPAGEHRVVSPDSIADDSGRPRYTMHDLSFPETLRLCEQFSRRPREVIIFAIQPKSVDYDRQLSAELRAAMATLTRAAAECVREALQIEPR